jgi:hypothetical protein
MSQSVSFADGDADAERVGEQAPAHRQRSDAVLNRAKIIDAARKLLADNGDARCGRLPTPPGTPPAFWSL